MQGPRMIMNADSLREWILVFVLRIIKNIFRFIWRRPFISIPILAVFAFLVQIGQLGATVHLTWLMITGFITLIAFLWPWGMVLLIIVLLLIFGLDIPGQIKDMLGNANRRVRQHFSWDLPWSKPVNPTVRGYWLRSHWSKACRRADLTGNREFRHLEPKLLDLHPTPNGLAGLVDMRPTGKTAEYFVDHAGRLSVALGRIRVVARRRSDNIVECRFQWHDPLAEHVRALDTDEVANNRIAYGINEDGKAVTVSPFYSTLVGGLTGSGKSSLVWSYLKGLLDNDIPFVLTIIDPKSGMEFRPFKEDASFLYTETDYKSTLETIHKYMVKRERWLASQGFVKLEQVTLQNPLHVIIIDELIEVVNKDTDPILRSLLNRGRASGFVVWALSQAMVKEVIGQNREYFPQRIAFATRTREMTDAALGTGATSLGAAAHKLEIPGQEGVGYEMNESASAPTKFRALLVDADEKLDIIERTEALLALVRDSWPRADKSGMVYKFRDAAGEYIYIGKTIRGIQRLNEHQETKNWIKEVVVAEFEHFDTECATLRREAELIFAFKPKYNTQGKNKKMEPKCV